MNAMYPMNAVYTMDAVNPVYTMDSMNPMYSFDRHLPIPLLLVTQGLAEFSKPAKGFLRAFAGFTCNSR